MKKSSVKNLERALRWEKEKEKKAMNQIIMEQMRPLTETLIDIALTDRNPNAINSLLDRAFDKAAAPAVLDIQGEIQHKHVVFMPAQLMEKYAIEQAKEKIKTIDAEYTPE